MRRFRDVKNDIQSNEIEFFKDENEVIISNFQFNTSFDILVKKNDNVKVNQEIMKDGNNNKFLSPVSGTIKDVSLVNFLDGLSYAVTIENDKKYEKIDIGASIKNKDDLINICKDFGLCSNHIFLSKIIEKLNKKLIINAFDIDYIFNQKLIYINYKDDIEKIINIIKDLCKIEEIIIYTNIENFKLENCKYKLKNKNKKGDFLTLLDLKNMYNALSNEKILNLVSVTGGALNKSLVIDVDLGTKIEDIIDFMGGFKEDILEIENFKFTALSALNDFQIMEKKLRETKNLEDAKKLETLLLEKKQEAEEKLFKKLPIYHKKYLNCLSACFFNGKNRKKTTTNLNFALQKEIFGLHLLNNEQFY